MRVIIHLDSSLCGDRPACHGTFGAAESKLRRNESILSESPDELAAFK
jgi:hypothetical protein